VLSLPVDAQRQLKPLLQHAVLRRLLQSLTGHDEGGGVAAALSTGDQEQALESGEPGGDGATGSACPLAAWVDNPRVMGMLTQAARTLRKGEMSEGELEALLLAQLGGPRPTMGGGGGGGSRASTARGGGSGGGAPPLNCAVLPSHMLVEALNEHVRSVFVCAGGTHWCRHV